MTKKVSWEVQGKSLLVTVADGRSSQSWTVRQTHTADIKAATFREIAEALDPEPVDGPWNPRERATVPRQASVPPPPVLGSQAPFVSSYEPSQGVPSVIPDDLAEAQSLEELKASAYNKAQRFLGLVKEGHEVDAGDVERLRETDPRKSYSSVGGMEQATPPVMNLAPGQKVRERPKVTDPDFYFKDTR